MRRLAAIGLSPNVEADDVWRAVRVLLQPWRYRTAPAERKLQQTFAGYFNSSGIYLFNSGRSALLTYLQTLSLPADAEVALQAFTCNAVSNPILWAGLEPLYIDINPDTLTMSPTDLIHKITPRTKVLIIQHTFGQPADLVGLLQIAEQHNLIVIEDCAHALGSRLQNKLLGTFGDAAIFSFGRDKVISSVYGGMLLVNTVTQRAALEKRLTELDYPTFSWTLQQLVHPIITRCAIATWYWLGFGRALFALAQRLGILSLAVSRGERLATIPRYFPKKLPGGLAYLALHQFNKLDRFNAHRRTIAELYQGSFFPETPLAEGIFLRYTVRSQKRAELFNILKQSGIILGDWYWSVIVPPADNLGAFGYTTGSCPVAELAARTVINLPTHILINQTLAKRIAAQVKPYL